MLFPLDFQYVKNGFEAPQLIFVALILHPHMYLEDFIFLNRDSPYVANKLCWTELLLNI